MALALGLDLDRDQGEENPCSSRWLGLASGMFLVTCWFWNSLLGSGVVTSVFLARDLGRAQHILEGVFRATGPEITGGGNLPGPLYYFLLLPAALSSEPWTATWTQTLAFGAAGVTLLTVWATRRWGWASGLLLYFGFLFSGHVQGELLRNWSASYSVFFQSAALIALLESWTHRRASYGRELAGCFGVLAALSLQIHATSVAIIVAFLLTWAIKREYYPWKYFLAGLVLPSLPGLFFGRVIETDPEMPWTFLRTQTVALNPWGWLMYQWVRSPLLPFIVLLSAISGRRRWNSLSLPLVCLTGVGLAIHMGTVQALHLDRYAGLFQRTFLVLIVSGLEIQPKLQSRRGFLLFAIVLAVALIIPRYEPPRLWRPGQARIALLRHLTGQQALEISSIIYRETGWTFDQARRRVLTQNLNGESDLSLAYREAVHRVVSEITAVPDGYYLTAIQPPYTGNSKRPPPNPPIGRFLEGKVRFVREYRIEPNLMLMPYFWVGDVEFPEGIHNIRSSPFPEALPTATQGKAKLLWDLCKAAGGSCPVYWDHEQRELASGVRELRIELRGDSLSRGSKWETYGWIESYEKLFIRITCDGKSLDIAWCERLGSGLSPRHPRSQGFLAPYVRAVRVPCSKPAQIIGLGFEERRAAQGMKEVTEEGRFIPVSSASF